MIKVKNTIKIYEVDGEEKEVAELNVFSHWNEPGKIIIQLLDNHQYTVLAKDLKAAIDNATNIARQS